MNRQITAPNSIHIDNCNSYNLSANHLFSFGEVESGTYQVNASFEIECSQTHTCKIEYGGHSVVLSGQGTINLSGIYEHLGLESFIVSSYSGNPLAMTIVQASATLSLVGTESPPWMKKLLNNENSIDTSLRIPHQHWTEMACIDNVGIEDDFDLDVTYLTKPELSTMPVFMTAINKYGKEVRVSVERFRSLTSPSLEDVMEAMKLTMASDSNINYDSSDIMEQIMNIPKLQTFDIGETIQVMNPKNRDEPANPFRIIPNLSDTYKVAIPSSFTPFIGD